MADENQETSYTIGIISIICGALAFIPLLGVFPGVIAVILGIVALKKDRCKIGIVGIILGSLGILLTISMFVGLFFYATNSETRETIKVMMVQNQQLPDTINAIESYKSRFGEYPEKLTDLMKISSDQWLIMDSIQVRTGSSDHYFYYERKGGHYYLFSKGVDGVPFTDDDIFPLAETISGNVGYITP